MMRIKFMNGNGWANAIVNYLETSDNLRNNGRIKISKKILLTRIFSTSTFQVVKVLCREYESILWGKELTVPSFRF